MAPFDPNSLTFPPPEPYELLTFPPKPLLALQLPPLCIYPPILPSPPRKSLIDARYTLTTHIVPAAFPRSTPAIPLPELPEWTPNKDEYKASVQRTTEEILATKVKQWKGELDALPRDERMYWNCVNRYVRKGTGGGKGITLFLAHANGFPKEIWEPMLHRLVSQLTASSPYEVDEIWSWEAANHGDSCLLNRDKLGGIYDWRDNSRDILHFLQFYLPTKLSSGALPTHLSRLDVSEASSRKAHGLPNRRIFYIGHSFGGCSITRAALDTPALFPTLVMVDAMIRQVQDCAPLPSPGIQSYVSGAIARRASWPSREAALEAFAATPFFAVWDKDALRMYVECGLYEAEGGEVRLKMDGIFEGVCFAEESTPGETFQMLPDLDECVETRWLVAGKLDERDSELRRRVVWRRRANSSHIRILSSGHLIAQEAPEDLAKELHQFLSTKFAVAARKAML